MYSKVTKAVTEKIIGKLNEKLTNVVLDMFSKSTGSLSVFTIILQAYSAYQLDILINTHAQKCSMGEY